MRTIKFLLQKEFRQIFRDPTLLRSILLVPIIQLMILPWAANYEIKNIAIAVIDNDHSSYSQKLISKITASGYFKLIAGCSSYKEASQLIEQDKADIIMEIPLSFEKNLIRENEQKLFMAVNAINGTKALVGSGYLANIINSFNSEIRFEWIQTDRLSPMPTIEIASSNWFNPLMNYKYFMVPGILVMLVTMIGGIMCSLNIVREKEIGTMEQMNVSPIKKHHFILGKLIPFWIMGIIVFSIGLLLARIVYGITPEGSIGLLYAFLAIYLIAVLGLGLLVSTYSDTQQQAMSIAFLVVMVFNLMSGLFTPIESMPQWAQLIAYLDPLTYFIDVMRMVILKGSSFMDVKNHFLIISGFAVVLNIWAIRNYKKTT